MGVEAIVAAMSRYKDAKERATQIGEAIRRIETQRAVR
jgi:hypothetical protein